MVLIFGAMILFACAPGWASAIRSRRLNGGLPGSARAAIGLYTVSALLQLVFLGSVAAQMFTVDYSRRFAAVGIPCCMAAAVIALMGDKKSPGAAVSAGLSLLLWLVFVSMH